MKGVLELEVLRTRLVAVGVDPQLAAAVARDLAPRLRALRVVSDELLREVAPATSFLPMRGPSADAEPPGGPAHVEERGPILVPAGRPPASPGPLGAAAASAALRTGSATAVSLLDDALAVVERLNGSLRAFVLVDADGAHKQAVASDDRRRAGVVLGPCDGVIVAAKDVIDVSGLPTGAGSRLLAGAPPAADDAAAVARLRAAGAVMLGKTHTHEFALGGTGENPFLGDARNPWNPERITGGSSSGSAVAVATGMAHAALGTDAGGSVRGPAALCGVVGFKATFGRLSVEGVLPSAWSLDHLGTLTPRVADAALLFQVLADRLDDEPLQARTRVRVGVPRRYFFDFLAPGVVRRVEEAMGHLDSLGWERVDLDWPDRGLTEAADSVSWTINAAEAAAYHESWLATEPGTYGHDIRSRLELGRSVLATEYLRAQRLRRHVQRALTPVWSDVDLMLTPACPVTAFPHGTRTIAVGGASVPAAASLNRCYRIANLTGWPAVTVPCGVDEDGLPVGVQLMAPPWSDTCLLRAAEALEGVLRSRDAAAVS